MVMTTAVSRNGSSGTIIRLTVYEEYRRRNGGAKKFKRTKTITVYESKFTEVVKRVMAALNDQQDQAVS